MSKTTSPSPSKTEELLLLRKFREVDTTGFPDFYCYNRPLGMALWVLWIAKDKFGMKKLSAEQIALVIRDVKEISIDGKSINKSLNRAGDKIHTYQIGNEAYFEIMKPGKELLLSQIKEGSIELFYFEPDKRYTNKKVLSKCILDNLTGELKIVDPYTSERTLDLLRDFKNKVKFLTRTKNIKSYKLSRFLRGLQDFKSEYSNIEFKDYPHIDIHDRYIISSKHLVILGHSIKDLGAKESFAVVLSKDTNKNIVETLMKNFNRRWNSSYPL
ncbi:MAG: hypothetical protein AMJ90_01965 [candidate division Zixibacteria bacterium SM23_73_2]|nr:MAG: hypothetical protein AMJ90_01965 [candidate division Zixibacteria bacterium SM23_73_2]